MSNVTSKKSFKAIFTKYNLTRFNVAVLTFLTYAIIHANRKSFSNVKVLVTEEWTPSTFNATSERQRQPYEIYGKRQFFSAPKDPACKAFLGVVDLLFMAAYAVAIYFGGILGDRFNPRYLLCISLVATSAFTLLFLCVSEWIGLYSMPWYITFWILNGLVQGPVWPCCLAIMGNWFGKSGRGLIFGIWSSNASVGNVIGALIVADFVTYGYDMAAMVPAVLQVAFTVVLFFGLVVHPAELGMKRPDDDDDEEAAAESEKKANDISMKMAPPVENVEVSDAKPVSFVAALCVPGVIIYSLSYACLKLVNYAFFFWLPYYMNGRFHWSQADADSLSTWYDIGGIIGGIVVGLLSDRFNRPAVMFVAMVLSLPTIIVYNFLPDDKPLNAGILFIVGFLVCGVSNILSSAVAADLSRHPKVKSSKSALGTISGIIDGTGSTAAAVGQIAIPLMEESVGWDSVFYMLLGCCCLTCIGVGRMLFTELMRWRCCRQTIPCFSGEENQQMKEGVNVTTTAINNVGDSSTTVTTEYL